MLPLRLVARRNKGIHHVCIIFPYSLLSPVRKGLKHPLDSWGAVGEMTSILDTHTAKPI